jgi:hypothetical protein
VELRHRARVPSRREEPSAVVRRRGGAARRRSANADIFAVAPVVAPGHYDIGVGLIDASTRASLALPAGVNTTAANENHPSISTDGRRLAFERRDRAAGADRVIVADLTTGQPMDLFNAFDTASLHPTSPAITRTSSTPRASRRRWP